MIISDKFRPTSAQCFEYIPQLKWALANDYQVFRS